MLARDSHLRESKAWNGKTRSMADSAMEANCTPANSRSLSRTIAGLSRAVEAATFCPHDLILREQILNEAEWRWSRWTHLEGDWEWPAKESKVVQIRWPRKRCLYALNKPLWVRYTLRYRLIGLPKAQDRLAQYEYLTHCFEHQTRFYWQEKKVGQKQNELLRWIPAVLGLLVRHLRVEEHLAIMLKSSYID